MQFKKIVGFGDSWVWGDELVDPALGHALPGSNENTTYRESNCFIGQLGQHYQVPVQNFGIPGGSLQSTIWNYLWWLDNEAFNINECLVLIGLTDASRISFYDSKCEINNDRPWTRYVHSAWATGYSKEWSDTIKQVLVQADSKQQHQLNYRQTVEFFSGQSAKRSGLLFQFCTITPPCLVTDSSLLWSNKSLTNLIATQPNTLAKNGHPNELGHSLIAKHLISHIDSCIM